jgi:propionyl-CoA synthetase
LRHSLGSIQCRQPSAEVFQKWHHARYADSSPLDPTRRFWASRPLIDWQRRSTPSAIPIARPFARWFAGGLTNLCHNAVDRHLAARGDQNALICVSTETDSERCYSLRELHAEVQRMAAVLQALGVGAGDRVLVYMPMVPEAVFAMLACVRIGAIHSVVFGGFASVSLASRIDDAQPVVVVSADAGSRAGKVVAYKPLLDEAIRLARTSRRKCCWSTVAWRPWRARRGATRITRRCARPTSTAIVPVSGWNRASPATRSTPAARPASPRACNADTGGYAVALAASMKAHLLRRGGETYFSTSDIGWVVGHSYIVYGPLIAGMADDHVRGLPTRPDAGVWWRLVEKYRVNHMFSAPTAVRVLKKARPGST